ncbi:secretion protein [Chryseobacterium lactis]|uniref:Secretion protein n=1 Tax=Chryseobacterium lactis TaxID=1241981 RepID=A0A3G6RRC3_CHRLC|nr:T9SS type A sorting domain-containing protein [Chryseobacterium lactis]AZA80797.1 T9SS C-terminal target domain-containing protein [Chryseobacterium lactis]AZB05799.1 T9SS C-terminal target domain-containing protein [Chryseobacterium lactis]PNW13482.1 secretion protein [Chryseobacterium lactis]
MKKVLLTITFALANLAWAQFTTGTVSLSTGMTVKLDTSPTTVTMTLTGPDTSYLGVGFGGTGTTGGMGSGVDGFIYNVNSTSNTNIDYSFAGVGIPPSPDAIQDWTITSNTTSGGTRTIVATRSLAGGAGDTVFANNTSPINIFYAKGSTTTIANHGFGTANRGYAILSRAVLGTTEAVAESKKLILYPNPAKSTVSFKNFDKIKSVEVYEATGRKVKSIQLDNESINVNDLQSGNYYFEIRLKDGSTSYEKLIKK